MARIEIEKSDSGRTVLLFDYIDDEEMVTSMWFIPAVPTPHMLVCPPEIATALVDKIEWLTKPPWDGLDTVVKTQVRNAVKWIAEEVIK